MQQPCQPFAIFVGDRQSETSFRRAVSGRGDLMRTKDLEKVLEKLATTDKATLVASDGKMRLTSGSWEGEKVLARV